MRVEVLDNGGSPQRAVANARTAVSRGATAMITDGVGAVAVAEVTDPAALPVFVVFEGGASIVDPQERPTLFRLAPANAPMSRRLADYVSEKATKVALLSDSSSYGREGAAATREGLSRNGSRWSATARSPRAAATWPRRCWRPGARAPSCSSSGRGRPASPRSCAPRAAPAGTCRSTAARPARTRSSGSAWPTARSGWTA